ncbi:MAG TPA: hypothetical protein VKU85_16145, partial [bacterium]|nr:hypothetical protein [bacterium]
MNRAFPHLLVAAALVAASVCCADSDAPAGARARRNPAERQQAAKSEILRSLELPAPQPVAPW